MSSARVGLIHTYIYLGAANPSTQPGSAKEADIGIYIYTYIYTHTHIYISTTECSRAVWCRYNKNWRTEYAEWTTKRKAHSTNDEAKINNDSTECSTAVWCRYNEKWRTDSISSAHTPTGVVAVVVTVVQLLKNIKTQASCHIYLAN